MKDIDIDTDYPDSSNTDYLPHIDFPSQYPYHQKKLTNRVKRKLQSVKNWFREEEILENQSKVIYPRIEKFNKYGFILWIVYFFLIILIGSNQEFSWIGLFLLVSLFAPLFILPFFGAHSSRSRYHTRESVPVRNLNFDYKEFVTGNRNLTNDLIEEGAIMITVDNLDSQEE